MPIGISKLGALGIAKETTWGVAPTTITDGLVITSENFVPDIKVEPLVEIGGTIETRRVGRGIESWSGSIEFSCEIGGAGVAGIGEFLAAIFGTDTVTGAADPYTHTISVKNDAMIPSHTLWIDRNVGTYYQLQGFRPNKVTIAIDRATSTIPVTIEGIAKKEVTASSKVLSFSTEPLFSPSMVGLTIDGTTADGVEKVTIEINRELEAITGLTGIDEISVLPSKSFDIKLSATGVYGTAKLDDTLRNAYKTRTSIAVVISLILSANRSIIFTFNKVILDTFGGPRLSGSDIVRADFSGVALLASPGNQVVIKNSRSTSYT